MAGMMLGLTLELYMNIHFLEIMIDFSVSGQGTRTCKSLIHWLHPGSMVCLISQAEVAASKIFPSPLRHLQS